MSERNDNIKAQRRRRNTDALQGKRRRLALDESRLDKENYVYRFANDDKTRIFDLTHNDDWEVVEDRSGQMNDSASLGAGVSVRAGVDSEGQSMRTILLRKPKAYHDADVAARQRQIDETEKSLEGLPADAEGSTTYVPDNKRSALSRSVEN